jgi:hypothetical protein
MNYKRTNHVYNSNSSHLPKLDQKQVYKLVNELINRKPVQIKEHESIFEKSGNGKRGPDHKQMTELRKTSSMKNYSNLHETSNINAKNRDGVS